MGDAYSDIDGSPAHRHKLGSIERMMENIDHFLRTYPEYGDIVVKKFIEVLKERGIDYYGFR
jgi:hypothetical protein